MATGWIYIKSEPRLWTVGFYDPDGKFHGDSDHDNKDTAAERVRYLNGGDWCDRNHEAKL